MQHYHELFQLFLNRYGLSMLGSSMVISNWIVDGSTLYFKGLHTYEAVVDEVMEKGLANATQSWNLCLFHSSSIHDMQGSWDARYCCQEVRNGLICQAWIAEAQNTRGCMRRRELTATIGGGLVGRRVRRGQLRRDLAWANVDAAAMRRPFLHVIQAIAELPAS